MEFPDNRYKPYLCHIQQTQNYPTNKKNWLKPSTTWLKVKNLLVHSGVFAEPGNEIEI